MFALPFRAGSQWPRSLFRPSSALAWPQSSSATPPGRTGGWHCQQKTTHQFWLMGFVCFFVSLKSSTYFPFLLSKVQRQWLDFCFGKWPFFWKQLFFSGKCNSNCRPFENVQHRWFIFFILESAKSNFLFKKYNYFFDYSFGKGIINSLSPFGKCIIFFSTVQH